MHDQCVVLRIVTFLPESVHRIADDQCLALPLCLCLLPSFMQQSFTSYECQANTVLYFGQQSHDVLSVKCTLHVLVAWSGVNCNASIV